MMSTTATPLVDHEPTSRLSSFERRLTKTYIFEYIVSKNFEIMDDSGDGVIDEAELYAGLLLMHISLAKNAGAAACFPPDRATVDRMFREADVDNNGVLNKQQFHWVMENMCGEIIGRMFVYYALMILTVPLCASWVVYLLHVPEETYQENAIRTACAILVMNLIVPWLWGKVDEHYAGTSISAREQVLLSSARAEQRQQRKSKRASMNELVNGFKTI